MFTPIDRKEFEKYKNPSPYILKFLEENKEQAYSIYEIAKNIGMDPLDILPSIAGLAFEGKISIATIKDTSYYAVK